MLLQNLALASRDAARRDALSLPSELSCRQAAVRQRRFRWSSGYAKIDVARDDTTVLQTKHVHR